MNYTNIKEAKNSIRSEFKEKRKNIPPDKKTIMDKAICKKFISLSSYRYADTILLYSPLKNEIDTSDIFFDAIKKGKKVAYPRCVGERDMVYHYVSSFDELSSGKFGIKEPILSLPEFDINNKGTTICVLPALVYDKNGYRLGYGKGYYDKFLSDFKGIKAGLIYSDFIINTIPRGKYDLPSNIIVTEKGVISFAKN